MLVSRIGRKGRVTIPKSIRDRLRMKPGDMMAFTVQDSSVILRVLRGTILDLKGSVRPSARPENFAKVRRAVKRTIAEHGSRLTNMRRKIHAQGS